VQSTVARGWGSVDATAALDHPGVVAVLDHTNTPKLEDTSNGELAILQDDQIAFRGQIVALVLAESSETAREGARLVRVEHEAEDAEVELRADNATYRPDKVNPASETDTDHADVEAALSAAEVAIDQT
jgi:xanthine dehydrogenase YagR molybdenum-binding subunit